MTVRQPRTPGQHVCCGWCGHRIEIKARGRLPKWCSETCRHRAWEQRRARASDRNAVDVVQHIVTVEKTLVKKQRVEVPAPVTPRRGEWPQVLRELAKQLDTGRLYDRDLPAVVTAMEEVLVAVGRRRRAHRR